MKHGFGSREKYQGGKTREACDGSGHGIELRVADTDRIDRAYFPRLHVRLFAEK